MKKTLWVSSLVIMLSLMACTIAMASNWENVQWYSCETTLTLEIQTPYTSKGDLLFKATTVRIHPTLFFIWNTPGGSNTTLTSIHGEEYATISGIEGTSIVFVGVITSAANINTDTDATGSGRPHQDQMRLFGYGTYSYAQDYYSGKYDGILQLNCSNLVLKDNASDITTSISASGCTLSGGVNPTTTADVTATGYTFTGTLSPCTMIPRYAIP